MHGNSWRCVSVLGRNKTSIWVKKGEIKASEIYNMPPELLSIELTEILCVFTFEFIYISLKVRAH